MIFADSFFFIALINDRDPDHENVVAYSEMLSVKVLTTEFIIIETANALAGTSFRGRFIEFVSILRASASIRIVWSSPALVEEGFELYNKRQDKQWSLTDCISFVVMKQRGITEALTHDHHFKQAGFRVLL